MANKTITGQDHIFFIFLATFFVILGWLGFILALAGVFYSWIFIIYFVLGISLIFLFLRKNSFKCPALSKEFCYMALFLLAVVIAFSFFSTPTIFSGRDQGSISETAIRLAQNHQLEFSTPASEEFFKIYPAPKQKMEKCVNGLLSDSQNGNLLKRKLVNVWCGASAPGKALNFPGFYYTPDGNLITQFPLPYISWLAVFYSIFGLSGLIIANAVLFFIFALSFYLLARLFLNAPSSMLTTSLIITFFPIFWFSKFTLSENMALALVWLGILQLALFIKNKNALQYILMIFTFGLLAFSRIEGFVLLAALIIIMLANRSVRDFLFSEKLKRIYLPALFLISVFIINFSVNLPFFKEIGKALLKNSALAAGNKSLLGMAAIFFIYGAAHFVFLGAVGIIYFLKNKKYAELLPFFLTLPVFIYLINPNISFDHPWMLRRYIFIIFPMLIFYSALFLSYCNQNKKLRLNYVIMVILLVFNIPLFARYFSLSENEGLLEQTKILSQNFSNNDLVLIDRLASGDGWSMVTGPMSFLYGKNSVYFFNIDDLFKINLADFDKIYLITPEKNTDLYKNSRLGEKMIFYKDYALKSFLLGGSEIKACAILPDEKNTEAKGKIFEIKK